MESRMFCQSCSMPIDNPADRGTEKDGSKSDDYCKYCYQNGAFVNSNMSMGQMISFLSGKMKELDVPIDVCEKSIAMLPFLKRWRVPVS